MNFSYIETLISMYAPMIISLITQISIFISMLKNFKSLVSSAKDSSSVNSELVQELIAENKRILQMHYEDQKKINELLEALTFVKQREVNHDEEIQK